MYTITHLQKLDILAKYNTNPVRSLVIYFPISTGSVEIGTNNGGQQALSNNTQLVVSDRCG
jgi:hypothetical protein